jgi:outer membrane protein TolC
MSHVSRTSFAHRIAGPAWLLALVGAWLPLGSQPRPVCAQTPVFDIRPLPVVHEEPVLPDESLQPPAGGVLHLPEGPSEFAPWWQDEVLKQLRDHTNPLEMTLDSAVLGTLNHSPQVRIVADTAQIQRTAIMQAAATFDPKTYMQTNFVDTSDPVGSLLTTGGAKRFIDENWNFTSGLKQKTATGAQIDFSQRLGYQNNNSIYFVPDPQGTAKTALNLTQPLLQGAGRQYNNSLIVLAEISAGVAHDQMSKDLQTQLVKVYEAYWDVYLQRAALLQKRKLHRQAIQILDELNSRSDVDVLGNQLVRARAAVAARQSATIRYQTEVQNAEARLRNLINDPVLMGNSGLELIPTQRPSLGCMQIDLCQSLGAALVNRPEINQANREMRAAAIRADVSKNEVLPVLNLILGTYVYGLNGNANIPSAFGNQYVNGRPTFSTGLYFEIPYGNRAANARLKQRRLELRQAANQLQIVAANVRTEVEIAAREVTTTHCEMISRKEAMIAADSEVQYLLERWRSLPSDQQMVGVVLHDLLNAQERLVDAEFGFVRALADYNVALIQFKRATGTFLQYERIIEQEVEENGVPRLALQKAQPMPPMMPGQMVPGFGPQGMPGPGVGRPPFAQPMMIRSLPPAQ